MKNVLFMLSSMNVGGVEKSFLSYLKMYDKSEYQITVLLLDKTGGFLDEIPNDVIVKEASWYQDIKYILMASPYNVLNSFKKHKAYLKMLQYVCVYYISKITNNRKYFIKWLFLSVPNNKMKYDIAVAFAGPTELIDYYILKKVNAKNKITWMHFDPTKIIMNYKFYNYIYKTYNEIYVVSQEAKNKLENLYPISKNKMKVYINELDSRDILDKANENILDIKIDDSSIILVTVGRLSYEKGQDLALESLSILKAMGINIKWYFIGEGSQKNQFIEYSRELKVDDIAFFLGVKQNPYPYIKMSDIYVQPSRHEGFCLSLKEAIILKKNIVSTNFSGASEQLKEYGEKYIICDDSSTNIANSIIKMIKSIK